MRISPILQAKYTTVQNNKNKETSSTSFCGWNPFKKFSKNISYELDSKIQIFSSRQLRVLRKNTALEINEILQMNMSPMLKKRLDDLLHSPFVDYETKYINHHTTSLMDKITTVYPKSKGTEAYRQFVLTSLSETMPLNLLNKDSNANLTKKNGAVKYLLSNYHKTDENTPQAEAVRKMIKRLTETGIPIIDKEFYLAHSIMNNQPLISKTYIDLFNISPAEEVRTIHESNVQSPSKFWELRKYFNNAEIYNDTVTNNKFFIIEPDMEEYIHRFFTPFQHGTSTYLYQLTGLSKDKNIRELFDIIQFLNRLRRSFLPGTYQYFYEDTGVSAIGSFTRTCSKYHPEMQSLEFLEKYIKSFPDYNNHTFSNLGTYSGIYKNEKLNREINNKIEALSLNPTLEDNKEIDFLKMLYNLINRSF